MDAWLMLSVALAVWQPTLGTYLSRGQRFLMDSNHVTCNFESGLCGYSQDASDKFDWTRHSGRTASQNTGPTSDHTLGQGNNGYYMYIEASSPRAAGDVARLISPPGQTDSGQYSAGFYYSMFGSNIGTLNVYVSRQHVSPSFSAKGNLGTSWHYGCVDIPSNSAFNIVFEGSVGLSYYGDIAIDDVILQKGTCSSSGTGTTSGGLHVAPTSGTTSSSSLACNFEHDICKYTQDITDDRDWERHAGNTTSGSTGPDKDHTLPLGRGFYIYMETSSPVQPGDKARLLSPTVIPSSEYHSVTFWYHMHGSGMGTLNVYAKTGTILGSQLFSISGDQGSVWRQGCVELPGTIGAFQLVFEGVKGSSYLSDIAVDDINVSTSHCHVTSTISTAATTTTDPTNIFVTINVKPLSNDTSTIRPSHTTTSFAVVTGTPTSSVTCDFDQEQLCGYSMMSQSTSVRYNWQWTSGQTLNLHTGPARDHTTGHGHYMAAVSLGTTSAVGARANMYSPYFDTTGQSLSVQFWYNTYSSHPSEYGALYLYLDHNGQHGNSLFSSIKSHHSTQWQPVCVDIPTGMRDVRLLFQAVHGNGVHGDIAVDDVNLVSGTCGSTSMTTPSSLGTWSSWGSFSSCSSTCGTSYKVSSRVCTGGTGCAGQRIRTAVCHQPACTTKPTTTVISKVDGSWSYWTTWSPCSSSCGMGTISRTRMCNNPTPSGGGSNCTGETTDQHDCSLGPCPAWSMWFSGPCSVTCNNGTMEQFRHCSSGHDEDCTGSPLRHVVCSNPICI